MTKDLLLPYPGSFAENYLVIFAISCANLNPIGRSAQMKARRGTVSGNTESGSMPGWMAEMK